MPEVLTFNECWKLACEKAKQEDRPVDTCGGLREFMTNFLEFVAKEHPDTLPDFKLFLDDSAPIDRFITLFDYFNELCHRFEETDNTILEGN